MIEHSDSYGRAITARARRTRIMADAKIISPDIRDYRVWVREIRDHGEIVGYDKTPASKPEQLYDEKNHLSDTYIDLERNRWVLDGTFDYPDEDEGDEIGVESLFFCDYAGVYETPPWVMLVFSNVSVLQAVQIFFSDRDYDGFPTDFTVEIRSGSVICHREEIVGNMEREPVISGFTAHNPTAIKVSVSKWSHPNRRARFLEVVPGIWEKLTERNLNALSVKHEGDISSLTLPYGTADLTLDNSNHRYDPRSRTSIFKSLEARQSVVIKLGVDTDDGTDYKPLGVFYHANNGWTTADDYLTIKWNLVDIIGLLSDRKYKVPDPLPITVGGWVSSLVEQLGENFADRYSVDADYMRTRVVVNTPGEVADATCGDILMWVCQAAGLWARADAETGFLTVEPYWECGNQLTFENLERYPVYSMNDDISSISVVLHTLDGSGGVNTDDTRYYPGTNSSGPRTVSIDNPFIHTEDQARAVVRHILDCQGGFKLSTTGRGDPTSEIGDVDTIEIDKTNAVTGRRISQTFQYSGGVLRGCQSEFLQANGWTGEYERVEFTYDGEFTVPEGVTELEVFIVGGGNGGEAGQNGEYSRAPYGGSDDYSDGEPGSGGLVYHAIIDLESVMGGSVFDVHIGEGGAAYAFRSDRSSVPPASSYGSPSTFGQYSSADGHTYDVGYTDVRDGKVYGRTGVVFPAEHTGDGGAGGTAGLVGIYYYEGRGGQIFEAGMEGYRYVVQGDEVVQIIAPDGKTTYDVVEYVAQTPTDGTPGENGASGCVVIYYKKPGGAI